VPVGEKTAAIILAAGKGTRMESSVPKPLHLLCGKPLTSFVVSALVDINVTEIVTVVGYKAFEVSEKLHEESAGQASLQFVEQVTQNGTGHATLVGLGGLEAIEKGNLDENVLVLPGDAPLLRPETLKRLLEVHNNNMAAATILTALVDDPTGYGRIIRDAKGRVIRIVEDKDALPSQLEVREVNTSVYCFRRTLLPDVLEKIVANNSQGEFYLTDVIELLQEAGYPVLAVSADDPVEAVGVNDQIQLAVCEKEMQERIKRYWSSQGVEILDWQTCQIDANVEIAEGVIFRENCSVKGNSVFGAEAKIGPDVQIFDSSIGDRCRVWQSIITSSAIGDDCRIGPYVTLDASSVPDSGTVTGPL